MQNVKRFKLEENEVEFADNESCFIEYDNMVTSWCNAEDLTSNSSSIQLLKSSRGRVSVCPTRFNDSVISLWNKDNVDSNNNSNSNGNDISLNKRKFPFCDSELVSKKQIVEVDVLYVEDMGFISNHSFDRNESMRTKTVKIEKWDKVFRPQDFVIGDIVWAKCSHRFPAWPAIVINAHFEAPVSVQKAYVPNTACVMFYGYSKKGTRV